MNALERAKKKIADAYLHTYGLVDYPTDEINEERNHKRDEVASRYGWNKALGFALATIIVEENKVKKSSKSEDGK